MARQTGRQYDSNQTSRPYTPPQPTGRRATGRQTRTGGGPVGGGSPPLGSAAVQGADVFFRNYFSQFGLPSTLADWALGQLQQGFDASQVLLLAQDRPEWQQRFVGNEERRKRGLPVLSPAEYLATETAFKSLMRNYELPEGMYDNPADFATLIGYDVSPDELRSRLDMGVAQVAKMPDETKDALLRYYNVDSGHLLGYVLDPKRGLLELERQIRAAELGAAGNIAGVNVERARAEKLAAFGVDFQQALQGYANVRSELETERRQGFEVGSPLTNDQLEEAAFFNNGDILERIRRRREASLAASEIGGGTYTTAAGAIGLRSR